MVRPARKRQNVEHLKLAYDVSSRRACRTMWLERSSYYYKPTKSSQAPLRLRIKELAATRVRYFLVFRKLQVIVIRDGVNPALMRGQCLFDSLANLRGLFGF